MAHFSANNVLLVNGPQEHQRPRTNIANIFRERLEKLEQESENRKRQKEYENRQENLIKNFII